MLSRARALLAALPGTTLSAVSRLYETAPVGGPEQADYLNQVVEIRTTLTPTELLRSTQGIETELGRERLERWGPRTIDLDILWYDGFKGSDPLLRVPHPRMEERRFVIEPLAELAPDLVLPSGRTVRETLSRVQDQQVWLANAEKATTLSRRSESRAMDQAAVHAEIRRLAEEKDAVILAHNYQRPEVQDVADFVGDSLGLSRQAASSTARLIVFCGVHFMAETAAILAPDKTVIMPDIEAGCPMADMIDAEGLKELKEAHPGAVVVSYVNSTAAVKALSDICCTSANAVKIVKSIPADKEIIFTPDRNLGSWAARKAGRDVILWQGFCPTHELIDVVDIELARAKYPNAKVVVHPECIAEVAAIADAVESTSGMIRFCCSDDAKEYLIGTELGMLYRLSKDCPGKQYYPVTELTICPNMKMTTLDKVLKALRNDGPVVSVDAETRENALLAVQRMVEVSP